MITDVSAPTDFLHSKFIIELTRFLQSTAGKGTIVTTRQLKRWVRALDSNHPVKVSYGEFLHEENLSEDDIDKITNHMKYVPGFYQTNGYPRRVGKGTNTRVSQVRQNKIKISSK